MVGEKHGIRIQNMTLRKKGNPRKKGNLRKKGNPRKKGNHGNRGNPFRL
jgi:hypothetical protein